MNIILCKFKIYNVLIWYIYILQYAIYYPQANISILSHKYQLWFVGTTKIQTFSNFGVYNSQAVCSYCALDLQDLIVYELQVCTLKQNLSLFFLYLSLFLIFMSLAFLDSTYNIMHYLKLQNFYISFSTSKNCTKNVPWWLRKHK